MDAASGLQREGLQVLRYQQNQHYGAHWDYFQHHDGFSNGGNRYATVLTYLSDAEEGGETVGVWRRPATARPQP